MNEEGGQRQTLVLRTMQSQVTIPLSEALDGNDSLSRRVIRSTVGDRYSEESQVNKFNAKEEGVIPDRIERVALHNLSSLSVAVHLNAHNFHFHHWTTRVDVWTNVLTGNDLQKGQ